jgi:hypothetical protein
MALVVGAFGVTVSAAMKKDMGWWVKRVIVPLIGSGGVVTLIVHLTAKPPLQTSVVSSGASVQGSGNVVNVTIGRPNETISVSTNPQIQIGSASFASTNNFASLESCIDHLETLEGRFAEREDFEKQAVGHSIVWQGVVGDVSARGADIVVISVDPVTKKELGSFEVQLAASLRVRAFALKRGDIVQFAGLINNASRYDISVSATNFWLETP